jgi:cytidylate kinase
MNLIVVQAAGKPDTFDSVLAEVNERDSRDMNREVSPLKPAEDSVTILTGEPTHVFSHSIFSYDFSH